MQDLTGLLLLVECRAAEYYLQVAASKCEDTEWRTGTGGLLHLVSLVTNDQQISKELGERLSTVGAIVKNFQNFWIHGTTAWKLISFLVLSSLAKCSIV